MALKCSSLNAIVVTLMNSEKNSLFLPYLSTLISNMITLSKEGTIGTRIDSLRGLTKLSNLEYEMIYPFRKKIVRSLKCGSLDDPKRVVRKEAVLCSNAWSQLKSG